MSDNKNNTDTLTKSQEEILKECQSLVDNLKTVAPGVDAQVKEAVSVITTKANDVEKAQKAWTESAKNTANQAHKKLNEAADKANLLTKDLSEKEAKLTILSDKMATQAADLAEKSANHAAQIEQAKAEHEAAKAARIEAEAVRATADRERAELLPLMREIVATSTDYKAQLDNRDAQFIALESKFSALQSAVSLLIDKMPDVETLSSNLHERLNGQDLALEMIFDQNKTTHILTDHIGTRTNRLADFMQASDSRLSLFIEAQNKFMHFTALKLNALPEMIKGKITDLNSAVNKVAGLGTSLSKQVDLWKVSVGEFIGQIGEEVKVIEEVNHLTTRKINSAVDRGILHMQGEFETKAIAMLNTIDDKIKSSPIEATVLRIEKMANQTQVNAEKVDQAVIKVDSLCDQMVSDVGTATKEATENLMSSNRDLTLNFNGLSQSVRDVRFQVDDASTVFVETNQKLNSTAEAIKILNGKMDSAFGTVRSIETHMKNETSAVSSVYLGKFTEIAGDLVKKIPVDVANILTEKETKMILTVLGEDASDTDNK